MFVAHSRFIVANGMEEQVRQAFLQRPGKVDTQPGFVRMEVLRPLDRPQEFWLITYWTDEQSWRTWYRGHSYQQAHLGIPRGLKLDPEATRVRYFELITE